MCNSIPSPTATDICHKNHVTMSTRRVYIAVSWCDGGHFEFSK